MLAFAYCRLKPIGIMFKHHIAAFMMLGKQDLPCGPFEAERLDKQKEKKKIKKIIQ